MKNIFRTPFLLFVLLICFQILSAQIPDRFSGEELETQKESPMQITLPGIFQDTEVDRDDYRNWQRQRSMLLQEGLGQATAMEAAVDPETYLVGPGDVFTFNIWGAMEQKIPTSVSPEGLLSIPSVKEFDVDGKTLKQVQNEVIKGSKKYYTNSDITLTLMTPRFIRVHISGAVQFPGSYTATCLHRVSQLIVEAGGATEDARKQNVQVKHLDGSIDQFDYASFETMGAVDEDLFLRGGDMVYVPVVDLTGNNVVEVQGDLLLSGYYQFEPDQDLLSFLTQIKALKRSTSLQLIHVLRDGDDIHPYAHSDFSKEFKLQKNDIIVLPANYVYVRGRVERVGSYRYNANLTAKDYAAMAGASGSINRISVIHAATGERERGANVIVEPGDTVDVPLTLWQAFSGSLGIASTIVSLVIAAVALQK